MHRLLCRLLCALLLLLSGPALAGEVVDLAGRTVQMPDTVERIILGDGRFLTALSILDRDDPAARIVGMLGDFKRFDPAGFAQYAARFPQLADVPEIGQPSGGGFSIEQGIALAPDVALLGLTGHGPSLTNQEVIAPLEAAGVAVVFIDFRLKPLEHTTRSMTVLGQVLGREAEAAAFVEAYETEMAKVDAGVAKVETRPLVFLESRVGLRSECCESIARAMLAGFVTRAGGRNMADDLLPGVVGLVGIEHLLTHQPDVYVATAIGAPQTRSTAPERIVLGAGVDPAMARESFAASLTRDGIADLDAVRDGRAYALWHHFYNSPFNVAAVQALAKWLHPQVFADLDPAATLASMYDRFQPVPLSGTYWIEAP